MGRQARLLVIIFSGVASPHSKQPVAGGVSTSTAAALQPGSQGEGKIVGNVASFSNLPRIEVFPHPAHRYCSWATSGNTRDSKFRTFFLFSNLIYRTNAKPLALVLLEDQRFLLKLTILVRNQLLSQSLNGNRPIIPVECSDPGAIHAGYLRQLGGGHFLTGNTVAVIRVDCLCSDFQFFFPSLSFRILDELPLHASLFLSQWSQIPFILLLSRNGISSREFWWNATSGSGMDLQTPWCQYSAAAKNTEIGGQWCKSCICSAHEAHLWRALRDQTSSLWSLRFVEQGFLWGLRYLSRSSHWAMFHLR